MYCGHRSEVNTHLVAFFYTAAAESPDGLPAEGSRRVAEATGVVWRTVREKLHDLDTRRVFEVIGQDNKSMNTVSQMQEIERLIEVRLRVFCL